MCISNYISLLQSLCETFCYICRCSMIILIFKLKLITYDLGSERTHLGSERTYLGSERTHLGSERTNKYFKPQRYLYKHVFDQYCYVMQKLSKS